MLKNFSSMTIQEGKDYLTEHFIYEVHMLFFALNENITLLKKIQAGKEELIDHNNIALEDFLLHARNLLEFFYGKKKAASNYIQAHHFFDENDPWSKFLPPKTLSIKEVEYRINYEITHLGAKRISGTPPNKNWDTVSILHDFMNLVRIFIDYLPKKYYSTGLNKY